MDVAELSLVAFVAGVAGVITAIGGVLLAIRSVRSKERQAAKQEIDQLSGMLSEARDGRIAAEMRVHELELIMVKEGIAIPQQRVSRHGRDESSS